MISDNQQKSLTEKSISLLKESFELLNCCFGKDDFDYSL